jgi:hypothetical protein
MAAIKVGIQTPDFLKWHEFGDGLDPEKKNE